MELNDIVTQIEEASNEAASRKATRQHATLRGIRGTPPTELSKIIAQVCETPPKKIEEDFLDSLFYGAWEDGIVAIALLSLELASDPDRVFALAMKWLEAVDDVATADTLGWLLIGPCALSLGIAPGELIYEAKSLHRPQGRRAVLMAAMAWLPIPIEGPASAALLTTHEEDSLQFVTEPRPEEISALCSAFVRDDAPCVQKALRRISGEWALFEPNAALKWMNEYPGGVPKMIREGVQKKAKKGKRAVERRAAQSTSDDSSLP